MTIRLAITMGSDIIFPYSMLDQMTDKDPSDYMFQPSPSNELMIQYDFFQNYMAWLLSLADLTYEEKSSYIQKISAFVGGMDYTIAGGSGVLELEDTELIMADKIVEFFKDYPTCSAVKLA